MNCQLKDDYAVDISMEKLTEKLHLSDEDDIEIMRDNLEKALSIARPKTLYRVCTVDEIDGDRVVIDGVAFYSEVLAGKLADIGQVIAYISTCGTEVDEWSHLEKDYVVNLWLDILKEMILNNAHQQFREFVSETFEMAHVGSMSPGSGNLDTWPIKQQRPLFSLLGDVQAQCGVELTEGFLMVPTKTVSGVLFPSEADFVTCALCARENCPNRKAPYDPNA